MVIGRRDTGKASERWAKLKRYVKSGAYTDDWGTIDTLAIIAQTVKRMNSKEKTMIENGIGIYIDTSRSKAPDTARGIYLDKESSEENIFGRLQENLAQRNISRSSKSTSRPVLISSQKARSHHEPSKVLHLRDNSDFEYDQDEDIKLDDLKSVMLPKKRLFRTDDLYSAACSLCKVTPVSNFLRQCSSFQIDLKNSFLSPQDVKAIAISLVKDHRINSLDISGNEIGAIGVMYIAEMMVENSCIIELNLSGTIPGKDGLQALAELLKNNKSLQILRLDENRIQHTEMQYIIDIIQNVPSLQELYLGHNALGFEGGNMLAKILETNTTLRVLDLQWNQIRKDTAKAICKAVGENKTLWTLNLSWNGLGKEGCIELSQSLKKNTRLSDLNVASNRIDMTSLRFLLHGLVHNKGLRFIQLGRNPITTEGAKAVIKAIQKSKCSSVENIQLEDISVDEEFLELLEELKETKSVKVTHGELINGGNAITEKEHDPHDLNRFDPVLVLVEYMRIDNLRLIDFFQYLDTGSRERLSKSNFRDGVANLGIPLTEHHLDIIMEKLDIKKDGVVDLEEFMTVHREVSRQITQRTTRAKSKKKEDEGLIGLRKIIKEIIEKRNKTNKEKAQRKVSLAAASRRFSISVSQTANIDSITQRSRPSTSEQSLRKFSLTFDRSSRDQLEYSANKSLSSKIKVIRDRPLSPFKSYTGETYARKDSISKSPRRLPSLELTKG